jgi:hypothetical protein
MHFGAEETEMKDAWTQAQYDHLEKLIQTGITDKSKREAWFAQAAQYLVDTLQTSSWSRLNPVLIGISNIERGYVDDVFLQGATLLAKGRKRNRNIAIGASVAAVGLLGLSVFALRRGTSCPSNGF